MTTKPCAGCAKTCPSCEPSGTPDFVPGLDLGGVLYSSTNPRGLLAVKCGTRVKTFEPDPLVVSAREGLIEFGVSCEEVVLTSDGRRYIPQWHEGTTSSEPWVRVERWNAQGREFHGYIDAVSRKLVQTG